MLPLPEQQFLKLLLSQQFYLDFKAKIPVEAFGDYSSKVLETIMWAHEEFKRDIDIEELAQLHFARNPSLTTAQKGAFSILFDNIKDAQDIKPDTAKYIVSAMWRTALGAKIIGVGTQYVNGEENSLNTLRGLVEGIGEDFVPTDFERPVTNDVFELLELIDKSPSWKFNVSSLAEKIPGMSDGEFLVILARPETGKTAAIINFVAGPGGFAEQGAKVHIICNEEPARRHALRAVSSFTGMTAGEIKAAPQEAFDKFKPIKNNVHFVDDVGMNLAKLDRYCKYHKPDIVIVDQLDRVTASGNFESSHERLGEVYSYAREIAKRHKLLMIGVSQASAEAEGLAKVHYSMAEGSKTAKAATADVVLGIGINPQVNSDDYRTFFISKNKISGWHGLINVKIIQALSRYTT